MATKTLTGTIGSYTFAPSNDTLVNYGSVLGGTANYTGIIVTGTADTVINHGTISGYEIRFRHNFSRNGGLGLTLASGGVVNNGLIKGGVGGGDFTFGVNGAGGGGVSLLNATLSNGGTILGGDGGGRVTYASGPGGGGGAAVMLDTGSLGSTGTITGGAGGGGASKGGVISSYFGGVLRSYQAGGTGGAGIKINDATLTNSGNVTGGAGGAGGRAGTGGAGLSSTGVSTSRNTGTIAGGRGGDTAGLFYDNFAGAGGTGVDFNAGRLTNDGVVLGGQGGGGTGTSGGHGGIGVVLTNATLVNSGTIVAGDGNTGGNGEGGGTGLLMFAGTVVNTGTVRAGNGGDAMTAWTGRGGDGSVGMNIVSGSVINHGLITGGDGGDGGNARKSGQSGGRGGVGGTGVYLSGGSITNTGTIIGGAGGLQGLGATTRVQAGSGNGVRFLAGGTLSNSGTIIGSNGYLAVNFGSGTSRLILSSGAVFVGDVQSFAPSDSHLELASSATTGTVSGIGSHYKGFSQISVGSKASWAMAGSNIVSSGYTLTNQGSLGLTGFLNAQGLITGVDGASGAAGNDGIALAGGFLFVPGVIQGGDGGASGAGTGGRGGSGIGGTSGTVAIDGTITGGTGGAGTLGGAGGAGISLTGVGTIEVFGTLSGGAGGSPSGVGGAGITLASGGRVTVFGSVAGGAGTVAGEAINLGAGQGQLRLSPTASVAGKIFGGSGTTDRLDLMVHSAVGTRTGLGGTVTGFEQINVYGGAQWVLAGTLTEQTTLTNAGTIRGTESLSVLGRVANTGLMTGSAGHAGLSLTNTGTLTNRLVNTGTIQGGAGAAGVSYAGGGTLTNAGLIAGGGTGVRAVDFGTGAARLILKSGATFTGDVVADPGTSNTIQLAGTATGALAITSQFKGFDQVTVDSDSRWVLDGTLAAGTTLTNAGTIAGADALLVNGVLDNRFVILSGGNAVFLGSGTLVNSGTISGGLGVGVVTGSVINTGSIYGLGTGVSFAGGATFRNQGIVRGGSTAVNFGTGASRLIVGADAQFIGQVIAASTVKNTMQLVSSASAGTITGIGSQFVGFKQITVDSQAAWTIAGSITSGVTLTNDGSLTTRGSLQAGGVLLNNLAILGGTSTGNGYAGLTLSGGTITNAGTVQGGAGSGGGNGGAGIGGTSGTIINSGLIAGGSGAAGGAGVSLSGSGTIRHTAGLISGANGADAVDFGTGASRLVLTPGAGFVGKVVASGTGAQALELATSSIAGTLAGLGSQYVGFNQVTIVGGASWTMSGSNTLGSGGTLTNLGLLIDAGIIAVTGSLANSGSIIGLGGGAGLAGKTAITVTGTAAVNSGTIAGGAGGADTDLGGTGGNGGHGVLSSNATFVNSGLISGGAGGQGGAVGAGGKGGTGIVVASGSLSNTGTITGGAGGQVGSGGAAGTGGIGVAVLDGSLTNTGTILGGTPGTGGVGGTGVMFTHAATLRTTGLISGGGTGSAIVFGDGPSRLILTPQATLVGAVLGATSVSNTLELASASGIGTLTSFGSRFTGFDQITITQGANWTLGGTGGSFAGVTLNSRGTFTNDTVIDGAVVSIYASRMFNRGTIAAAAGTMALTMAASAYLLNSGFISGGTGAAAIEIGAGGGIIAVAPGGSFSGAVSGNPTNFNALEFASGAGTGTIDGLGIQFTGFHQVNVRSNAQWVLAGTNSFDVATYFRNAGDMALTGGLTNSGTMRGLYQDASGIGRTAIRVTGGSLTNHLAISGAAGANGGVIGYGTTGKQGGTGVSLVSGRLTNDGTISGGAGGLGAESGFDNIGGAGGVGIHLTGGDLDNTGTVLGGAGGNADYVYALDGIGGKGGAGLLATAVTITNDGTVIGGTGGTSPSYYGAGGAGGTGAEMQGGALTNTALIRGGQGGLVRQRLGSIYRPAYTGAGGTGVSLTNARLTNTGTIQAGAGGRGYAGGGDTLTASYIALGGVGGAGVSVSGGTVENAGLILGGTGGAGAIYGGPAPGGAGGTGLLLDGGSLHNSGTITGGAGQAGLYGALGGTGGAGISVLAGTVSNSGTITGGAGAGGQADGVGIVFASGGTLLNAGLIAGTGTAAAVTFGTGASRLILSASGGFTGDVIASASFTNILQLASAASTGTLTGFGTQFTGFGRIEVDAGALWTAADANSFAAGLSITNAGSLSIGNLTNGISLAVTDGGRLRVRGSVVADGIIAMSGTTGVLQIAAPTLMNARIVDFDTADTINLAGIDPGSVSLSGGFLRFTGGSIRLGGTRHIQVQSDGSNGALINAIPCFAEGTRIATPHGQIPVEALRVGDTVITAAGQARPIRWIGSRTMHPHRHPRPLAVTPIRVRRHALADGVPARDLRLSPEHALVVRHGLVPVRLLVNGGSITRETECPRVTYFHIELDTHDILLAEGAPAESYLDTGNRALFEDGGAPLILHPDFAQADRLGRACLPFIMDPRALDPIWRSLADRGLALGHAPPEVGLTQDADPRLIVDEQALRPIAVAQDVHTFLVPPAARVRLRSRATTASLLAPWGGDDRMLGLSVRRIRLHQDGAIRDLPLDHPGLRDGWWDLETNGHATWRWTNGDAALPIGTGPARIVEITAGRLPAYSTREDAEEAAAERAAS